LNNPSFTLPFLGRTLAIVQSFPAFLNPFERCAIGDGASDRLAAKLSKLRPFFQTF
jgi:hypothetical protein